MRWLWTNLDYVAELTWQHAWLSLLPTVAGFVLAVPLGWWASRRVVAAGVIVTGANIAYAIPSLPLFVILPGLLGTRILNPINVAVALTVYAVAVMIRPAVDGFAAVDPAVRRSATAMGYSWWQRAVAVELPVAAPMLLAGVRVVMVSTVSLVSVGALVGVRSLGSLFTNGFQRHFATQIMIGIVGTVALALLLDLLLVLAGRWLLPWTRIQAGA